MAPPAAVVASRTDRVGGSHPQGQRHRNERQKLNNHDPGTSFPVRSTGIMR